MAIEGCTDYSSTRAAGGRDGGVSILNQRRRTAKVQELSPAGSQSALSSPQSLFFSSARIDLARALSSLFGAYGIRHYGGHSEGFRDTSASMGQEFH